MKTYLYFIGLLLFMFACQEVKPDLEQEKQALLKLHEDQREMHLTKNAKAFGEYFTPDFTSVNRGKISQPSKEEHIQRFQAYFDQVEFVKWDDANPPQIRFSDDGKLAYMIVDKMVEVTYPDTTGQTLKESVHFAWVTICRKQANGEWKIECVASTNEPEVIAPVSQ